MTTQHVQIPFLVLLITCVVGTISADERSNDMAAQIDARVKRASAQQSQQQQQQQHQLQQREAPTKVSDSSALAKRSADSISSVDSDSPSDEAHMLAKRAADFLLSTHRARISKRSYRYQPRGAPWFVGKRALTSDDFSDLDDDSDDDIERSESQFDVNDGYLDLYPFIDNLEDKRGGAPKFVGKRKSPWFVGKRGGAPKFVGKRDAPKFVGKRGAPWFLGKRGAPWFLGKRGAPLFLGKRGAPLFLGKRGAPLFLGKRGAPLFLGKRGAPWFLGKRGAPVFVGKRRAPKFVGKRLTSFDPEEEDEPTTFYGDKRQAPKFVGRRSQGDEVMAQDLSDIWPELSHMSNDESFISSSEEEVNGMGDEEETDRS